LAQYLSVRKSRILAPAVAGLWLLAVALGMVALWNYTQRPGTSGTPPHVWPKSSSIHATPGQFRLIAVIHPHCPCSRATIGELAVIMAHSAGRVSASAIFVGSPDSDSDWIHTDLWRKAAAIPGVHSLKDNGT